jgi:hypothetical protein
MRGQTKAFSMMVCAGLAASGVRAGVEEIVWVEVDNSVGTMGDTAGVPTGLDGVRTFDLYAVVTPDTNIWAADFGYVGVHQGFDDNMWTTQAVYQHGMGGDVQSVAIGMIADLSALEFDTYVGLGMLDSQVVMNTAILSVSWSPAMFQGAWFGTQYTADSWIPSVGDAEGRVFLARISVASDGGFGELTGGTEWLGGRVFLSGDDDEGEFGMMIAASGLFVAPNAFPVAAPTIAASDGGGWDEPDEGAAPEPVHGDLNGDGVVSTVDLQLMQGLLGTSSTNADLNSDGIVDAQDVGLLTGMLGDAGAGVGTDDDPLAGLSPKERKQAQKRILKEQKKLEAQQRKEQKLLEKERRKQARLARQ